MTWIPSALINTAASAHDVQGRFRTAESSSRLIRLLTTSTNFKAKRRQAAVHCSSIRMLTTIVVQICASLQLCHVQAAPQDTAQTLRLLCSPCCAMRKR